MFHFLQLQSHKIHWRLRVFPLGMDTNQIEIILHSRPVGGSTNFIYHVAFMTGTGHICKKGDAVHQHDVGNVGSSPIGFFKLEMVSKSS